MNEDTTTLVEETNTTTQAALRQLGQTTPLVNAITNDVTVNQVANIILHWGGLPVMSDDVRELDEMVNAAEACLLNMGTVSETGEEAMMTAGQAASEHDAGLVLDPVGAGATATRSRVAERLSTTLDIDVINGNRGEVAALVGEDAEVRGVESVGEHPDAAETAIACAQHTEAVVVSSGVTDIVATAETAFELNVGDEMLGTLVGTGCMLGGTIAAFCGGLDDPLTAALTGTVAFGLAGEAAANGEFGEYAGPASYETTVLDAAAGTDPEMIAAVDIDNRVNRVLAEAK
ncbi:hydroxyethylthiazole kinase [Haloquadratum walsbyi]|uniref:Hydroxyethylthiazole kinase n=1 Tax=Haloquadratum walsbyi (strain DSM 16854 / JCM 12705 / C23) TaxID=768065 RepID=G0LLH6_HALWC|nr:hydroxyethylthiazole kinase [Haloquadratum walsbyi]CCC40782.1 hydroxyethylthiazole kinase [Haloquadratum walsbyi C23]